MNRNENNIVIEYNARTRNSSIYAKNVLIGTAEKNFSKYEMESIILSKNIREFILTVEEFTKKVDYFFMTTEYFFTIEKEFLKFSSRNSPSAFIDKDVLNKMELEPGKLTYLPKKDFPEEW